MSVLLLTLAGWAMIVFFASANTTLQLSSPDNLRGRVMSPYGLVMIGLTPFGNPYAAGLANYWGAGTTFIISGVIVLVFWLGFSLRKNGSGAKLDSGLTESTSGKI